MVVVVVVVVVMVVVVGGIWVKFGWVLGVFPYVKPSKNLQEPPQEPPGTLRNP